MHFLADVVGMLGHFTRLHVILVLAPASLARIYGLSGLRVRTRMRWLWPEIALASVRTGE